MPDCCRMPSIAALAVSFSIVCILWAGPSQGAPNRLIYSGELTENGQPVEPAEYEMRFRIYESESEETVLWDSGAVTVSTGAGGQFSTHLEPFANPTSRDALMAAEAWWLAIEIDGDVLDGRQPIAPAPATLAALEADRALDATMLQGRTPEQMLEVFECRSDQLIQRGAEAWQCVDSADVGPQAYAWSDVDDRPAALDNLVDTVCPAETPVLLRSGDEWTCAPIADVLRLESGGGLSFGQGENAGALTLTSEGCEPGWVMARNAADDAWACTANIGLTGDELRVIVSAQVDEQTFTWAELQDRPEDLIDGDADSLAAMECPSDAHLLLRRGDEWICGPVTDALAVESGGGLSLGQAEQAGTLAITSEGCEPGWVLTRNAENDAWGCAASAGLAHDNVRGIVSAEMAPISVEIDGLAGQIEGHSHEGTASEETLLAHTEATTNVHGLADTAALLTPSSSLDAERITQGTLSPDYFSAFADLTAENRVGRGEGQLAPGDHDHGFESIDAYADLQTDGRIGAGAEQVAPGIHAHGVDDIDAFADLEADGHIGAGPGQLAPGSHLHNAEDIDAFADLQTDGRIGAGAEQVAPGRHAHGADDIDAYLDLQISGRLGAGAQQIATGEHGHDDRYARADDGVVDTLVEMASRCAEGDLVRFGNGGWVCVAPDDPIPPDPGPGPCREAVAAPQGTGANVLDYIHPDHHAAIRDKTQGAIEPPVDFGPCIQAAIDAVSNARDKTVIFPAGTYTMGQTLTLPSGIRLSGTGLSPEGNDSGASMLLAIAQGERLDAMMEMDAVEFIQIEGLTINGGSDPGQARAGIAFDHANHVQIRNNHFINFFDEDAAIYGGGGQYMTIEENVFNVDGFAIDSLSSYVNPQAGYGIGVGTIASNEIFSAHGIRIVGIIDILQNHFDGRMDAVAMVNIQGEVSSNVNITDNYFDLAAGATRLKAIRVSQANGTITGNRIIGDNAHSHDEIMPREESASRNCEDETVAIDAGWDGPVDDRDFNYIGAFEISGNTIAHWDCGITHYIAVVNNPASSFTNNVFMGVLKPLPGVFSSLMPYDPGASDTQDNSSVFAAVPGGGMQFRNTAIVPTAVPIASGSTTIDLSRGNTFHMLGPVEPDPQPVMITTVMHQHSMGGHFFTMHFPDGNVTLKHGLFRLAARRHFTPPAGSTLHFVVGHDEQITEVGNSTLTLGLQKQVTLEVEPLAAGETVEHSIDFLGAEPTYTAIHASSAQPPVAGIIYDAFAIATDRVTIRITNIGHPSQDPVNPPFPPSLWKITGTRCPP